MKTINHKFLQDYFNYSVPNPIRFRELCKVLRVGKEKDRKYLQMILDEMVQEGILVHIKGNRYAASHQLEMVVGQLQCTSKGTGYLIPEDPTIEEIVIRRDEMGTALHLDKVMVKIIKRSPHAAPEGRIVNILQRTIHSLVGTYQQRKKYGFVAPDDPKILTDLFIPPDDDLDAQDGQKVVVQIVQWDSSSKNPIGKIKEILGFPGDPRLDELIVLREFNLQEDFPAEVEKMAAAYTEQDIQQELESRLDLRNLATFTIDPVDAKDFDDAVSIEEMDHGWRVGVHIADVSHYVSESSPLDQEAYLRSTSVYLVNKVVPMLPHSLSNNLCSLMPQVDRLAVSVLIDLDQEASVRGYTVHNSVIQSHRRYSYEEVQTIIDKLKKNPDPDKTRIKFGRNLWNLYQVSRKLRDKRIQDGSLELDIPEVKIVMENDQIKKMAIKERLESHQLVEEFMLLANRIVALDLFQKKLPILYRVHDIPDAAKIDLLSNILQPMNIKFNKKNYEDSRELQSILKQVRNTSYGYLVERILLRTLKKACYQVENIGHYALSFKFYTHFTSPIRRYPDLLVHRMLKLSLRKRVSQKYISKMQEDLPSMADYTSDMERKATEAERLSIRLKQIEYMKQHLGDDFDGIISGVTSFGMFIEIPENLAEGMIHLSELSDDYYIYDENRMALVGKRTRKVYRMGDKIRIKVASVSSEKKRIDFVAVKPTVAAEN
ncbi:MAG: ribonuclease R [Candidatus Delongbacteria bacterium]|nr:ribonuclease R [Candidatus Delongbacteria bacterium]